MRTLSIVLAVLAAPAAASANALTDASVDMDDEAATITLFAAQRIGDVRLRTEPGLIRVWLSTMDDVFLDPAVPGRAIRSVRVRPGAGGTAVVQVRVSDRRTVAHESIRIERADATLTVRIARAALPAEPAPAAVADPPVAPAESPVRAEPDAEPVAAQEPAVAETEPASAAPARTTRTTRAPRAAATPSTLPDTGGSGALGTLALVTLLLGLMYLGARIFASGRKKRGPAGDIEIVSAKRLGGRHQLVVVRALGEDHLLSVHGGQTARIASTPAPVEAPSSVEAPTSGLLGKLTSKLAHRRAARIDDTFVAPQTVAKESAREDDRRSAPHFGAQLLQFTRAADRPESPKRAERVERASESEAVAGLLRLRQRAAR